MQTLNYKFLVQLLFIFQKQHMFISAFFHIFSFKGFLTLNTGPDKMLTYLKI